MNKINYLFLTIISVAFVFAVFAPIVSSGVGQNVTVITQLEVGNVFPEILSMDLESNVILIANTTKTVTCLGLIQDWNNETNITMVNSTIYEIATSTWDDIDDNNYHYSNSSCSINLDATSSGDPFGFGTDDEYHALATCTFEVEFYANPGAYNCSMYIEDTENLSNREETSGSIDSLLAIGLPTAINYGIVDSITISDEQMAIVTNVGNTMINLSLYGYADTPNDEYAMNCTKGSNKNILIGWERYNLTAPTAGGIDLSNYSTFYTNLTSSTSPVKEFNLDYNFNDTVNNATKDTYWRMYVPKGLAGTCDGNIVFGATIAPGS